MLDLTSTDRYYDWQKRRFKSGRVRYRKVATEGHVVPRWRTVRSVSWSAVHTSFIGNWARKISCFSARRFFDEVDRELGMNPDGGFCDIFLLFLIFATFWNNLCNVVKMFQEGLALAKWRSGGGVNCNFLSHPLYSMASIPCFLASFEHASLVQKKASRAILSSFPS